MEIAGILKNEHGKSFWCDVSCIVKKPKRLNRETLTQDCVLSDSSGDIEATLDASHELSVESQNKIRIIRAEVQHGANAAGTKLFVYAYVYEKPATEPEPYAVAVPDVHYTPAEIEQNKGTNWDEIARRGIRKDLVCALVNGRLAFTDRINALIFPPDVWEQVLVLTERIFSGK